MKTCTFAGHAQIYEQEEIEKRLKKEIENLIENESVTNFYNGCKGSFDFLCADCVFELKKEYPFIKSYWVQAYMPKENDEYIKYIAEKFDQFFYPNLEKIPPHFAILKRNEWMIKNSDFLIAYVKYNRGGAFKTLEFAEKKKNIKIINIGKDS